MDSRLRRAKRVLILRQSLASLADNLSAPYVGYYFASLSGSGTMQGLLQMSVNSVPTLAQVAAGFWLDRRGRHVALLLATSTASAAVWLLTSAVQDPGLLLALITARAVLVGVSGLALTALVAELFGSSKRGEVLSYLNAAAQLTALPVFAAMIFTNPSTSSLRRLFAASGAISLAASATWLTMLKLDRARGNGGNGRVTVNGRVLRNRAFVSYTAANSLFTFSMAFAWPLFPLAQRYVLAMSVADLALLNFLSTASLMASQYAMAKRIAGRDLLKLTLVSRAGVLMFPIVYAVSPNPTPIFVWQALSGPFVALGNIVAPLYVLEVAEPELKASYLSIYNLAQGLAASLGSAVGGAATDRIVALKGWEGVRYGFAISAILRAVALIPLARMARGPRAVKGA